ncbi:MAG: hypothetical protein U0003_03525 [Vampirovibrionales bacterium]
MNAPSSTPHLTLVPTAMDTMLAQAAFQQQQQAPFEAAPPPRPVVAQARHEWLRRLALVRFRQSGSNPAGC